MKTEKKEIYFTVTGIFQFADIEFIKEGMELFLEKKPDNDFDNDSLDRKSVV